MTLMNCVQDYGRRALEGVARYGNAQHGGWTLSLHHREQVRQALPRLDPAVRGIIAHAHAPRLIAQLADCGVPAVNTSAVADRPGLVSVVPDDPAIGRMAADYLMGRGYRRLLALDMSGWAYSAQRVAAFRAAVDDAGASVRVARLRSWRSAERLIAEALTQTPTPIGLFAVTDGLAVFVVRQCLALGLAMPEQVAVLGVDNDSLTTRMVSPTISSVEVPWEKLGAEAAARLDRLIRGRPVDPAPLRIAPARVVTRQTTDGQAIEDPMVADVVRFVREHVGEPFTIDQALEPVPASRRALEQRFKRAIGRTLQDHITRVRLERAKQLLTETDLAMPEVAQRSGFSTAAYFAAVFRKHTGKTPTAFRAGYRLT